MTESIDRPSRWVTVSAVVAIGFGLLTIFSGGTALFGAAETRAALGNVVPFVLWFNFVAGFFYVIGGIGLWMGRRWSFRVAIGILVATAIVAAVFGWQVLGGTAYEVRTVLALVLRMGVWLLISIVAWRGLADSS